jgi:hypothetical protein
MITLVTGTPGAGKTLWVVGELLKNAKSENIRPVYTNINGLDSKALKTFPLPEPENGEPLALGYIEDGKGYSYFEEGSIIVIDECQFHYPPRPAGSKVPDHIAFFNVHRHAGIDIYLITQGPKLIDQSLRTCVGSHKHVYRPLGIKKSYISEWSDGVNLDPEPSKNQSNANKTKVTFDKDIFKLYNSTKLDTHKSRVPYKKWAIMFSCLFILLALSFYYGSQKLVNLGSAEDYNNRKDDVKVQQEIKPIIPDTSKESIENNLIKSSNDDSKQSDEDLSNPKELRLVGSIIDSKSFKNSMFWLSSGDKISDFMFRFYNVYDRKIYLCRFNPCSKHKYDYVIDDYPLFAKLYKHKY